MADTPARATAQDVIDVLRSIDASLKQLLTLQRGNAPPIVATDSDLDGQWGDPVIRAKDPRDWTGESQLGKPFSECPAEYLDLVAARLDFFAEKAEAENTLTTSGKPVAPYNRRDAARARGWAARIRHGYKPTAQNNGGFPSDAPAPVNEDEIAF
jgi:hypothetical protein